MHARIVYFLVCLRYSITLCWMYHGASGMWHVCGHSVKGAGSCELRVLSLTSLSYQVMRQATLISYLLTFS